MANTTWNIFYNSDKEIIWSTTGNVDSNIISTQASNGLTHVALDLPKDPTSNDYYINGSANGVTEKTVFNPTFSNLSPDLDDVVNVTGLPAGTEVFVDGNSAGTMSNTTLTFTIKEPGSYKIMFSKLYYKPHSPVTIKVAKIS